MMVPNATVLNLVLQSLRDVAGAEGWRVETGKLTLENPLGAGRHLVLMIPLSGRLSGALQWRMSYETAQELGRKLAWSDGSLDEVQISGLAEMLNVVLGQALGRLERSHMLGRPAPPVVLIGNVTLVTPGFPVLTLPVSVEEMPTALAFAFQMEPATDDAAVAAQ